MTAMKIIFSSTHLSMMTAPPSFRSRNQSRNSFLKQPCRGKSLVLSVIVILILLTATFAATDAERKDARTSSSSSNNSIATQVRLNDGNMMPVVGLGVALTADATYNAVHWALAEGYRLIDTASEESYGNEDSVGAAVRDAATNETFSITRDDVFVTTKLWDSDHGFYETLEAFDESFDTLDIGTMDLYLIHSPFGGKLIETWDALLYVQKLGYVKSIGVSNFGVPHLQAIKESGRPLPTVNQIEMHPLVYQQRSSLIEWCRQHNVKIQAYGSLMHGYPEWLSTPQVLVDMTEKYSGRVDRKITTAQILLRWALQHDFLIIPKSSKQKRIIENSLLYDFELSEDDMAILDQWGDGIQQEDRNLYERDWGWNPIDEARVHLGKTHFWPDYDGVHYDEEEEEGEAAGNEL